MPRRFRRHAAVGGGEKNAVSRPPVFRASGAKLPADGGKRGPPRRRRECGKSLRMPPRNLKNRSVLCILTGWDAVKSSADGAKCRLRKRGFVPVPFGRFRRTGMGGGGKRPPRRAALRRRDPGSRVKERRASFRGADFFPEGREPLGMTEPIPEKRVCGGDSVSLRSVRKW